MDRVKPKSQFRVHQTKKAGQNDPAFGNLGFHPANHIPGWAGTGTSGVRTGLGGIGFGFFG